MTKRKQITVTLKTQNIQNIKLTNIMPKLNSRRINISGSTK